MADACVILRIKADIFANLLMMPEIYRAAPFLNKMENPMYKFREKLKKSGCGSCARKAAYPVFLNAAKTAYRMIKAAREQKQDMKSLKVYLSNVAGKVIVGFELDVQVDGQTAKVMLG